MCKSSSLLLHILYNVTTIYCHPIKIKANVIFSSFWENTKNLYLQLLLLVRYYTIVIAPNG